MTNDSEAELRIINAFTAGFATFRNGMTKGELTGKQQVELLDFMGACFRDFVELQRSYVSAAQAIEKAKT